MLRILVLRLERKARLLYVESSQLHHAIGMENHACLRHDFIVTSARLYRNPQGDHMFQVGEAFYCYTYIYIYILFHDLESAPACMCAAQAPMHGELYIVHVAARAPCDVGGPWARCMGEVRRWRRRRRVWKFGNSKSGNLRTWKSRNSGSKPSTKLELQNQNPCHPTCVE